MEVNLASLPAIQLVPVLVREQFGKSARTAVGEPEVWGTALQCLVPVHSIEILHVVGWEGAEASWQGAGENDQRVGD